ncbi:Hypothetical predicted protein [Octopus vulgaris]|uniref:Uncharacterized protein n=1 Tax=Octopus vulgaris TaxID=6645 RepID=A0AA36BT63_OCTVU|nr:Hypothetical predicted protein [Octopus vulgaris]
MVNLGENWNCILSGTAISFTSGGVIVNSNDIAPSYVGIIFGIGNTFAAAAGSINSLTTKALTPNDTQIQWQIVFALCAAICVVGAIFFAIMARGEIQVWARSQEPGSRASLLTAIGFLRCDQTILITSFLFLSGIAMSFASGGALVNTSGIAQSYVGIIFGIGNTFAAAAGSINSLTTKALTSNDTQEQWQIVFALCAAICVVGAIFFAIMARGEIQVWAKPQEPGSCRNAGDVNINNIVQ